MIKTIVIIEDDMSIREMLGYYFKSLGWDVHSFESGEEYFEKSDGIAASIFILDIMLPGMDGLSVLSRLRSSREYADVPIIMLTARTSEMDKVNGLESGADDYIVKPFSVVELQARVNALLRRTSRPASGSSIIYGDLEIRPASRVVLLRGDQIELTYKEFELLRLLASNKGIVLSRGEILNILWGYEYEGETRTVDMHVKSLRTKLGDDADNPKYIHTVRGAGYKMP